MKNTEKLDLHRRIPIHKRKELWESYLEKGIGHVLTKLNLVSKYDHHTLRRFLFEYCQDPYNRTQIGEQGYGKQESYWKDELEMIYVPPTRNELSFSELKILSEL